MLIIIPEDSCQSVVYLPWLTPGIQRQESGFLYNSNRTASALPGETEKDSIELISTNTVDTFQISTNSLI